jgi:hypothetical protein
MPKYVIERQYLLPIYQRLIIDARDITTACQEAVEDDDWKRAEEDGDGSGATTINAAREIPEGLLEQIERGNGPCYRMSRLACRCAGLIVPMMVVSRSGFVHVKRRMNSFGVMPSSRSPRWAWRQRSHCSPVCFPSVGAPFAAQPRMTMPAPF